MRYAPLVLWEFQRDNKIINQQIKPLLTEYTLTTEAGGKNTARRRGIRLSATPFILWKTR